MRPRAAGGGVSPGKVPAAMGWLPPCLSQRPGPGRGACPVFWLQCQSRRGKGLGTVACKTTFPSSMQMAAITWPLMTILNKRLGCDFALYYSPEQMYYKAEAFGLVGALRMLLWLCVHFLNAELKGAL